MAFLPALFGHGGNEQIYGHRAGDFLFQNGVVTNFIVTGMGERQTVVMELLRTLYGRVPVIGHLRNMLVQFL